MSDIVERLRNRGYNSNTPAAIEMREAADEIERLRKRMEYAWNKADEEFPEILRLRHQLELAEAVCDLLGGSPVPEWSTIGDAHARWREVARP